jgi:hypothetical protein
LEVSVWLRNSQAFIVRKLESVDFFTDLNGKTMYAKTPCALKNVLEVHAFPSASF